MSSSRESHFVRVRIVRTPSGRDSIPFDTSRFRQGEVHDVGPRLAELLIGCGCAESLAEIRLKANLTKT